MPQSDTAVRFAEAQTLHHAGKVAQALTIYHELIPFRQRDTALLLAAGTAELQLGHDAAAIQLFSRTLTLNPDLTPAHANIAVSLQRQKRLPEALKHIEAALALRPDAAPLHMNRGNILRTLEERDKALSAYNAAVRCAPDYAQAYNNRGVLKREMGDIQGALRDCEEAIALSPNYSEAWNNKGTALRDLNRPKAALTAFARAVEIRPRNASAQWQKGAMELLLGDYAHGWRDFHARWKSPKLVKVRPLFPQPEWLGISDPAGKNVLVYAEQGLGDTIQFARFVPELEAMGAKVILEVQPPLLSLLKTLPGEHTLVGCGNPLPDFALQVPLMSLPLALGTKEETIPAASGYLSADPEKKAQWQELLGPHKKMRVGLCWSGREGFAANRWRNMPLDAMAPLLDMPFEFHALQKDVHIPDRAPLVGYHAITPHMEQLQDFSDTAALISEMDLVITVDTSVAHVAGALGKPVWIITPQRPEWRWLTERTDTPWYASARLFRPHRGDWSDVIGQLHIALEEELAKEAAPQVPAAPADIQAEVAPQAEVPAAPADIQAEAVPEKPVSSAAEEALALTKVATEAQGSESPQPTTEAKPEPVKAGTTAENSGQN